ncbi:MAG TPA: type IV pilus modification protein PilV [Pseudomonas sp.]|jgi:type IV pilus assembly protein PilV|uniref:type IV pilus modification protein PilV n=1 Tax=Pseudomonas sp. TaxID=306 RepID=UPI002C8CBBBB|nr:type IV pilus modification protein PilV [Pseudomonas sp.]HSX86622.1 type IV pilus modification protein PilV [Pseudomonas sp.]
MNRRFQNGVSLIEVLISVLLFSVGLLGLAALQLNSMKANQTATIRSHATFLAYEMGDRMRAARGDAQAGFYTLAVGAELPCDPENESCLPFQRDLAEWRTNLARQLPNGDGGVEMNGDQFTVIVQWSEERVNGSNAQRFSFVSRI